jgi:hypothetical protein
MQTLTANTASQTLRLTLNEGRQDCAATFTKYLLRLTHDVTKEDFYLIPVVASETDRITVLTIGLNVDNAINGSIQITDAGRYLYKVYGQNSTTNLDPANATVVESVRGGKAIIERGWFNVVDAQDYFTEDGTELAESITV